ncbi:Tol-Pal system protein TolB-like protein [Drosera capensis]
MMNIKTPLPIFFCIFALTVSLISSIPCLASYVKPQKSETTILFNTVGRTNYNFDIYSLSLPSLKEHKLTDGVSVNFNGQFPHPTSSLTDHLVYVSERNGTSSIFHDAVERPRLRSALERPEYRVQAELISGRGSFLDRPSLLGDDVIVHVGTHQDPGRPRTSWAAVYSTQLNTGSSVRLSPPGVADFSPAVSPSGVWTAVASLGEGGWSGEVAELRTDIYVFLTRDGSRRVKMVEHGGWPTWADDDTIYFHRVDQDGWWSVWQASLPRGGELKIESVAVERITPPGVHAFTPAASPGNKEFIAVATRRPDSEYRHIELFDLAIRKFKEVTRLTSPETHHYNPFLSPDSSQLGYHKCRGSLNYNDHLFLENIRNPRLDISLFRVDGAFPSFSPSGDRIAFVKLPGLYVSNTDGTNRRKVFQGNAFSTAWDWVRKGVVYTSTGPIFAAESSKVDIISIYVDEENPSFKKLTEGGENNAFPSPSPDGKWVVFRSGRSGHKNLYIMDAIEGEKGGIRRLTDGPWTDTMCNWSPNGEWIAFATDRENPGSGSYELYVIHPNGTRPRRVIKSGSAGRANHPWFSPDGKSFVFTSDYAGVSAEPVSIPHQFQPYGDIFIAELDGSGIQRLTHNAYEDGTPTWGPAYMRPADVSQQLDGPSCSFDDCHFLNVMPKRGTDMGADMVTTRVQCV